MKKNQKTTLESEKKCACGTPIQPNDLACPKCSIDLNYRIKKNLYDGKVMTAFDEIPYDEYIERVREKGVGLVGVCAICGGNYVWWGNNPYPVIEDEESRCCSRCCDRYVLPARLKAMGFKFKSRRN